MKSNEEYLADYSHLVDTAVFSQDITNGLLTIIHRTKQDTLDAVKKFLSRNTTAMYCTTQNMDMVDIAIIDDLTLEQLEKEL